MEQDLELREEFPLVEKLSMDSLEPSSPPPILETTHTDFDAELERMERLEALRILDFQNGGINPTVNLKDLSYDRGIITPEIGRLTPTPWCLTQFGRLLGVKWHRFFAGTSNEAITRAIDEHLAGRQSNPPMQLVARTWSSEEKDSAGLIRGMVSSTYGELRDIDLFRHLQQAIHSTQEYWQVIRSRFTDRATHMNIIFNDPVVLPFGLDTGQRDDIYVGIRFHNSEVGFCSWSASLHIFRVVCTNGLIWPLEHPLLSTNHSLSLTRAHRGNIVEDVRGFLSTVIDAALNLVDELPKQVRQLHGLRVTNPSREIELVFSRFGPRVIGMSRKVMAAALTAPELQYGPTTAWHVLQALTSLSPRLDSDSERQLYLELLGSMYVRHLLQHGVLSE